MSKEPRFKSDEIMGIIITTIICMAICVAIVGGLS